MDDNIVANADFNTAWQTFSSSEIYDIIRVFTSGSPAPDAAAAIDVAETRGDMVAFLGPELADVYNNATATDDIKTYFTTTINRNSSYAFYVDNWKLVYDKWIPTDSDAAALHARTFAQTEPWFSPAGLNRGQLKNIIKLAWNPNKSQRDVLYKVSINSVVAFPGEGTVLFGDKTGLRRPSAFSRINVRTLFIVLKKNISYTARYQLFELNDFITRATFRNAVNQYLENVQARRGLYGFKVVCDETNNTPYVIDANQFVGDIYLKPARSINFIKLNFVAVATGADFEEVEGVS
jgi:phage tail sheath protein FI